MFGSYTDAAIAALRSRLPARIAAVNAATSDFDIEPPVDDGGAIGTVTCAYSRGVSTVLNYPWIEVAETDGVLSGFSLAQRVADYDPSIVCRVLYRHADASRLDLALKRATWAMLQALMEPDAFGQGETIASARVAWRTNPDLDEQETFVGGGLLVVTLEGRVYLET